MSLNFSPEYVHEQLTCFGNEGEVPVEGRKDSSHRRASQDSLVFLVLDSGYALNATLFCSVYEPGGMEITYNSKFSQNTIDFC
jgi:hypothetical protein